MFEEQDKETAKEWRPTSDRTDAIHYILAATECPKQVRSLINLLVGISNGYPEFETTQKEIATRISSAKILSDDENARQWVKRVHRQLKRWQDENQLNLIEYEPGSVIIKIEKIKNKFTKLKMAFCSENPYPPLDN
jgi:hypothetical protein